MKRILMQVVVLATLIAGISARGISQSKLDLPAFFTKNIGLSQDQITGIRNGQPVALALKSRIPNEIFLFGAIYIHADPERYVRFANDIDRLRKLPEYLAIGTFGNPPQPSDVKDLTFDSDDMAALKDCKAGDCMIQMPATRIEELHKSINWSAPDSGQQVNQLLQKTVVQRLLAYQQGGNQILGQYNDRRNPTEVPEQFKYMISYSKVLPTYLPGFYNYLLTYPKERPANVGDTFQWAKVKFGLKPTLRVLHIVTMRGSGPDEPAYAIAEKQLYSSHYFETALDLTFCIRDSQDPKRPGFYFIKAMGSEQAGLTGFKGSIVRKVAVSRSVSSLEKSLTVIKTALESQK
jgi:hypothetical protein